MSIAWPDPSPAPPPPPPPVHVPVPEVEVKRTRKKMAFWDRTKILIFIALLFAFLVWNDMADNPIIPFRDALRETARAKWWFFLAFVLELVRQIHYVICEHSDPLQHVLGRQGVRPLEQARREDEPVDALPHLAGAQVRVRQRRALRVLRRPVGRHADRGVLPGAVTDLRHPVLDRAGSAVHLPGRHAARPRGRPVRRHLLVPVARRRRHLLPRRHQDRGSPTCGARTRCSSGSKRT